MKKSWLIVFVFLFSINFVLAGALDVFVQTLQDHTFKVDFLKTDSPGYYGREERNTGSGEFEFSFTDNAEKYNLNVFLFKDGNKVFHKRFDDIENGQKILLFLIPGGPSYIEEHYEPTESITLGENSANEPLPQENDTSFNETTEVSENNKTDYGENITFLEEGKASQEDKSTLEKNSSKKNLTISKNNSKLSEESKISGFSFLDNVSRFPKSMIYLFIVLFFVIIIFFLGLKKFKKFPQSKNTFKFDKSYDKEDIPGLKKELRDERARISEIKKRIREKHFESIRTNRSKKIQEIEERLKRDEEELRKLKE